MDPVERLSIFSDTDKGSIFWELPDELTLKIFALFDDHRDLINVGLCNHTWYKIHCQNILWKKMVARLFPSLLEQRLKTLVNLKKIYGLNLNLSRQILIEERVSLSFKPPIRPVTPIKDCTLFFAKTRDIYKYSFKKQIFQKIFRPEVSLLETDSRYSSIEQLCLPLGKKTCALIDVDVPKRCSEPEFDMKKIWVYTLQKKWILLRKNFQCINATMGWRLCG